MRITTCAHQAPIGNEARGDTRDHGFSLIELIIVVVIIGILVAIAVPILANIEEVANRNALNAAAGNGASAVAATLANNPANPDPTVDDAAASGGSNGIVVTPVAGKNSDTSDVCVMAAKGADWAQAGPGCTGAVNSWTP